MSDQSINQSINREGRVTNQLISQPRRKSDNPDSQSVNLVMQLGAERQPEPLRRARKAARASEAGAKGSPSL